jgi:Phage major capsid protein E
MDLYSTDVLVGILEELTVPDSALLDRYFGELQTEESEEIHFDVVDGARKLAPFVSPVVEGKVVQERGFTTKSFKPAYLKPKTPIDPLRPVKRIAGEQFGGSMSAVDRDMAILTQEMENHIQLIRNRLEWMASQVLLTGAVTISGDDYQTTNVSYGRNAGHTVTLTGADLWSASTGDPADDLQVWAELFVKNGGGEPTDVIMETNAWRNFRAHAKVTAKLDYRRGHGSEIDIGAARRRGLQFKGTFDGFNIFTYQDWYVTDAGVVTPFLASGKVIMVGPALEGVQAFGGILDPAASYAAVPWFMKSWIPEDPPRRILLTQSAPLVVPYRPNASLAAQVL